MCLCKLLGAGGLRLPPLRQQHPAVGAVVEEDQGDKDKQEDGGGADVYDFVQHGELVTVQTFTFQRDGGQRFLGVEGQDDVGAHRGQEENPGYCGDDVGGPHCLQDVTS